MTSKRPPTPMRRVPVRIEWDTTPVVDEDAVRFATALKNALNSSTEDGYSLCFHVPHSGGLILVHQRVTELGASVENRQEELKGAEVH